MQSVLMRAESLSHEVGHRLELQKNQVWHRGTHMVQEEIDHAVLDWDLRHAVQMQHSVRGVIRFKKGFKFGPLHGSI